MALIISGCTARRRGDSYCVNGVQITEILLLLVNKFMDDAGNAVSVERVWEKLDALLAVHFAVRKRRKNLPWYGPRPLVPTFLLVFLRRRDQG